MVRVVELEYVANSALRFQSLLDLPWAAFLDSGAGQRSAGRYDVLTADPYATITTHGVNTEIRTREGRRFSARDPLELVAEALGPQSEPVAGLPFSGGALGFLAYDLGRRFERVPDVAAADIELPELAVGLYDWAVVVDHAERSSWLVGHGRDAKTFAAWDRLAARLRSKSRAAMPRFEVVSSVESSFGAASYAEAFATAQRHIAQGDCYQVNLTQRFTAEVRGDPWHAYLNLREINPAPFSAYLKMPFATVLSSSPERFLRLSSRQVETKPIKGTRPRASDRRRDLSLARELADSEKDRAENVMIVDLLRNDLGRVCEAGSIQATSLFDIESFASVHHMVSTVEGRLRADCHAVDLLRACFPGGSITGAPKLRAMEVIESLEPQRRSVYCGAIGYIGYDGNMDTNIAIRTLLQAGEHIHAWAGGGIVADSVLEDEYQESFDKAAALLSVLQAGDSRAAG